LRNTYPLQQRRDAFQQPFKHALNGLFSRSLPAYSNNRSVNVTSIYRSKQQTLHQWMCTLLHSLLIY